MKKNVNNKAKVIIYFSPWTIQSRLHIHAVFFFQSGEASTIPIIKGNETEHSSCNLKGSDLYGGSSSKAANKTQPPKTLPIASTASSASCSTGTEETTEALSTAETTVNMHPPVDYQQTPTHPHGATMATVPIPFQPIHDYSGKLI